MSLEEDALRLQDLIDQSHRIVFFGGAGVSTESGIPDFRSQDGLYNQSYKYPPEQIISIDFFEANPEEFYRFYKDRMLLLDKKPNACHTYLAKLEQTGKLSAVVTQNIDGLHQLAGSKKVYELHGSIHRNSCTQCGKTFTGEEIRDSKELVPHCPKCGAIIKPDVVLYGEGLNEQIVTNALVAISQADLLIVAGTSLVVYPAAGFIDYFQGKHLVLINKDPNSYDARADVIIHQKVGELFSKLHV
jgi:NAD-dependent deacetylase